MIQTDIPYSRCRLPMIGIKFVRHYALVCDNSGCELHRQIQGNIERETELGPITTFMPAPLPNTISPPKRPNRERRQGRKKIKGRKG